MGQYRLDSISQLARQMRFTPIPRRLEQLDAAEDLLLKLCPDQTYTLAEILCAITGYEPKAADQSMLTGVALQSDLGVLLEEVSESLQLHLNSAPEPILTIEDTAQRLSVTSKTVQRWRRRGLPARRYTFPDGKRRIGFRTSSVQRFLGSPSGAEQVEPIPAGGKDLAWLLQRANELASLGYWHALAAQRLSAQARLAPLSIQQILREHATTVAFAGEPDAATRARVVELREDAVTLGEIASRTCLPRFGVYRILLESRLTRAVRKCIRFHDDELFHQDDAASQIEQIIAQDPIRPAEADARIPRDLPPYLRDLYRIPLLSPTRERGLFLKYQYCRHLAAKAQRELDPQVTTYRQLRRFERLRRQARAVRASIVEANLRLVVSVARKHVCPGVALMELVSEGNLTLIRAVDSFDVTRGNRFSTYAVYALMRGFARYIPDALRTQTRVADPERFAEIHDPATARGFEESLARDEVARLLSRLDARERDVLVGRFGLVNPEMTSRQLATQLQLSSQRILQIEQAALAKLRAVTR